MPKKLPNFVHVANAPWENAENSKGVVVGTFYPCGAEPFAVRDSEGNPAQSEIYVHENFFNQRVKEEVANAWREAALFYVKDGGAINMDLLAVANQKRRE